MDAFLIEVVEPLFQSAWIYLVTVLFVALDGTLPLVPGEAVVITGAVLGRGDPVHIGLLVMAAFIGSVLGDTASYGVGRLFGARATDRLLRSGKRATAHHWATVKLHRNGGPVIIAARFLPGGRTATTLCAGTLRFPFRRFLGYAAVAGAAWAAYTTALGVVAGGAFADRPLQSVLLGLGLGVGLSMFLELTRRLVVAFRAARRRSEDESALAPTTARPLDDERDDEGADTGLDGVEDPNAPATRPILLESPQDEPDRDGTA